MGVYPDWLNGKIGPSPIDWKGLIEKFGPNPDIALVPRGGPENGPYSAMAARIICEILAKNGHNVSAIYPSSGSIPTAILGCTGDFPILCDNWANITPEKIVGKFIKLKTGYRAIMKDSLLPSRFLGELIEETWNLEKFCSSEAMTVKFQAVDIFSRESVTFSNKDPRHKPYLLTGVLGAMAIVPFLEPQVIYNPKGAGLIDDDKIKNNALLLVDGGYRSNMMLEMAMRDGFDVIFVIDVHGLKPTINKFTFDDLHSKFAWAKLLRNCFHLLSNANDNKQFQLADRINEEIAVRDELVDIVYFLEQFPDSPVPSVITTRVKGLIGRMNNDRLRLGDKKQAQIYVVSNEEYSTLFNFAKFTPKKETRDLMTAGWIAAVETLESLGFDTSSVMPVNKLW
ncbi:MAG: hypothetical protein Q8R55_06630 [Candidatus Taylorbacteria bacterium]|nr:hypothetical protein [Candidatus Taylorbacteria bacterium]